MEGYWDPLKETEISIDQMWEQLDDTATAYVGFPASAIIVACVVSYYIFMSLGKLFNYVSGKTKADDPVKPSPEDKGKADADESSPKAVEQKLSGPVKESPPVNKRALKPVLPPNHSDRALEIRKTQVGDSNLINIKAKPDANGAIREVLEKDLSASVGPPVNDCQESTPVLTQKNRVLARQRPETQVDDLNLTEEELKQYNGSGELKTLYVAVKGVIYDVTKCKDLYGQGKPYAKFAGKDVSKALAKWSLNPEDITGDIGLLSDQEKNRLDQWERKFDKKYKRIGNIKKTTL